MTDKPHPKPYGSPVVGYVRSARRGDPALDDAEAQIRAYCAEQGWNLAKVFREEGVSSLATWRLQFNDVLSGLERREWMGVLVPDESHLSRLDGISKMLRRRIEEVQGWVVLIHERTS